MGKLMRVIPADELVNVLYGGQTKFERCSGYCKHKGKYLTVAQMKKKGCCRKQCPYLDRLMDNEYWKEWQKKKENLKTKRSMS